MKQTKQELLDKYLRGTASIEERAQLLKYLRASEDENTYHEVTDRLWNELSIEKTLSDGKADVLLQRVFQASKKRQTASHWYRAAAVFGGLILLAGLIYLGISNDDTTRRYSTDYGETKTVWLPDSSKVTLNANSSLTFSYNKQKAREAWLVGEAFFEIKQRKNPLNASKRVKFIVHTNNIAVEVLGTAFNVSERRGATQVVLEHGKVRLANKRNEQVIMQPGDLAEMASSSSSLTIEEVNPEEYTTWKKKELLFKRTPITEVAEAMEDYYGWRVELSDDDWNNQQITGSIPTDDQDVFLKILAESMGVEVIREDNRVTLKKRRESTIDK
ncbi:MAG: FecR domain-containing protein [Tunicatimonas sp.]|uniref:FecR family protein n=1 Tax=Tunicatimonas sp. TaxID=1940096 RepID=UPI003C7886DB